MTSLSKTWIYSLKAAVNSNKINQYDPVQIKLYLQIRQLSRFVDCTLGNNDHFVS